MSELLRKSLLRFKQHVIPRKGTHSWLKLHATDHGAGRSSSPVSRVSEAVQLKDYLKEKYNIEPAGGGA